MDPELKKRRLALYDDHEPHNGYEASYDTPLHAAVIVGNHSAVEQLLKTKPVLVNRKNGAGDTALHCAARSGNLDIIRCLLNAEADAYAQNLNDKTPLHLAVEKGSLPVVKLLLSETLRLTRDKTGLTPVAVAVLKRDQVMVKYLLKIFPEAFFSATMQGRGLLHLAAELGDTEMLRLLLRHSKVVNKDNFGKTALHLAVNKGFFDAVELLLDAEVDATLQDDEGETALHFACAKGYQKIVELLIRRCPVLFTIGNKIGELPLHYLQPEHSKLMQWFMKHALGDKALMCSISSESLVGTSVFDSEEETMLVQGGVADLNALTPLICENAFAVALMHSYTLEEAAELLECLEYHQWKYSAAYEAILKQDKVPQAIEDCIQNIIRKVLRFYTTYVLASDYKDDFRLLIEALGTFEVELFFQNQLRAFPTHRPDIFMYHVTRGDTSLVRQWRGVFKECLSTESWFKQLNSLEKSTIRRALNIPISEVAPIVPMQKFSTIAPRIVMSPQSSAVTEVVKLSGVWDP